MNDFEPINDDEFHQLMGILNQNADKSFVKRILDPKAYPSLDVGDGNYATHRMAWGTVGDKAVVFPTVMMTDGGKLQDFGDNAWQHASKSGNFIEFDDPKQAEWFSQRYKGAWGGLMNKPPK